MRHILTLAAPADTVGEEAVWQDRLVKWSGARWYDIGDAPEPWLFAQPELPKPGDKPYFPEVQAALDNPDIKSVGLKGLARRSDPATSHEAARAITGSLTAIQQEVLDFARRVGRGGFTDRQLEERFNGRSTYRTRRSELTQAGLIVDSGHTRQLDTGRHAIVWVLKEMK